MMSIIFSLLITHTYTYRAGLSFQNSTQLPITISISDPISKRTFIIPSLASHTIIRCAWLGHLPRLWIWFARSTWIFRFGFWRNLYLSGRLRIICIVMLATAFASLPSFGSSLSHSCTIFQSTNFITLNDRSIYPYQILHPFSRIIMP